MEPTHLVFSGNGFWGRNSQWVSYIEEAKLFTEEAAIEFCKRRYTTRIEGPMPACPVLEVDARKVQAK